MTHSELTPRQNTWVQGPALCRAYCFFDQLGVMPVIRSPVNPLKIRACGCREKYFHRRIERARSGAPCTFSATSPELLYRRKMNLIVAWPRRPTAGCFIVCSKMNCLKKLKGYSTKTNEPLVVQCYGQYCWIPILRSSDSKCFHIFTVQKVLQFVSLCKLG